MRWCMEAWKKYAEFNGRARRKEYWMFHLFNVLIVFALLILSGIAESLFPGSDGVKLFAVLVIVYFMAILIPSLAVMVRRLHDTGKSGMWVFISFIPAFGGLILFFFMLMDGEGGNQYGPNPKSSVASDGLLHLS
jgi:uncharacterized membrane protein YhaH (DUF805 family)